MKAYQLLEKPEAWTKGAAARDRDGRSVDFNHPDAICWCVTGAIEKCYPCNISNRDARNRLKAAVRAVDWIHKWNDAQTTTHSQVLEVLKACDV